MSDTGKTYEGVPLRQGTVGGACLVGLVVEVEGAGSLLTDNQSLATFKIWFWVLRLAQAWKSLLLEAFWRA